ncbi:NMD3-related protein [Stetteria hydrogenophila]
MAVARRCPRCGREGVEFIGPLCVDCYREVYGLARLPKRVDYVYCASCGAYKLQGAWQQPAGGPEEALVDYLTLLLTRRLRPTEHVDEAWIEGVEPLQPFRGPGIYRARVRVGARAGGVVAYDDVVVEVNAKPSLCPLCTAKATERGYEAIVQIRSSEGRLSKGLKRSVEAFLSRLKGKLGDAVVKVDERREGIDLYVYDHASARMIASKLRAAFMGKTVETYKLVGRKPDGSRRGRLTISVRLPDINPGDVVEVGGRPMLYLAGARGGGLFVDLRSGRETVIPGDELWERGFRRVDEAGLRRVMLLSRSGPRAVLLDADSGYERVIEADVRDLRVYVEDFREGGEYLAYLAGSRIYIIREAGQGREG